MLSSGRALTCRNWFRKPTFGWAADFTACEITLNGIRVTRLDDYGPWLNLEVTDQLLRGRNVIQLRCWSSEGPSAIAATLTVVGAQDTQTVLRTDSSWECRRPDIARDATNGSVTGAWLAATCLGTLSPRFWNVAGTKARISTFDDYTQWKLASNGDEEEDVERFMTLPGFSIDRIRRAAPDEGSWVSMAFDPQGRITVAREDKGLLRLTLTKQADEVPMVGRRLTTRCWNAAGCFTPMTRFTPTRITRKVCTDYATQTAMIVSMK